MSDSLSNDVNDDLVNDDLVNLEIESVVNPVERFLRSDRIPHIWCPGCGIGTTVNSFARALIESKLIWAPSR